MLVLQFPFISGIFYKVANVTTVGHVSRNHLAKHKIGSQGGAAASVFLSTSFFTLPTCNLLGTSHKFKNFPRFL